MPPKKKEIRKEEEEIDLASLPPWTSFIVFFSCHPLLRRFFPQVTGKLASSTKTISRLDLINLAKERQFWIPANAQEPAPAEALAKAFKLKLLLLDIAGRKTKKEILTKIEDLEKRKIDATEKNLPPPTDVIEEPDSSYPDVIYLITEFPNTAEEVSEVAKEGAFVDMLLYLRPADQEIEDLNSKADFEYRKQVELAKTEETDPPEPIEPIPILTPDASGFISVSKLSDRNHPARDLLIKTLIFVPPPAKLPVEGEEPESNPYDAEAEFLESAINAVEDSARLYVDYRNWRKGTELVPLFPYHKPSEASSPAIGEVPEGGEVGEGEEGEAQNQSPGPVPVQVDMRSRDDEARPWDFRLYKKLFSSVPEGVADERCFVACLLQQLMNIGEGGSQIEKNEVSLMKEFFEGYWTRVRGGTGTEEMSARSQNSGKVVEHRILNEADGVEKRARTVCFPNTSTELSGLEHTITEELVVPGIRRFRMPPIPLKSQSLRDSERAAIYPFSSFPLEELERNLILTEFSAFLSEKEPGNTWSFTDRKYTEILNQSMLTIALSDSLLHDPDVYTHYYSRDDALLVSLLFKPRPRRSSKKQWKGDWRIRPRLKDWETGLKDRIQSLRFLDLDETAVGNIWEQVTCYYPADSSVIRAVQFSAGPKEAVFAHSATVLKDDMTISLYGGDLQVLFSDQIRLLCEKRETGTSLTVLMPGGLTVKMLPDGSVLQAFSRAEGADSIEEEKNRIITGMGTVLSCGKDGSKTLLFANGNVATKAENGVWVRTNNKGLRRGLRVSDGFEHELDSIPCACVTDSSTFTKTITREDMVMIIRYSDNSQVTQHRDGTKMFISPDGDMVLVEKEGYAPVKVRRGGKKGTVLGYNQPNVGAKDLIERSSDGKISEVFLPDGSEIGTFTQTLQTSEYSPYITVRIHLLQLQSGASLKLQEDGFLSMISSLQSARLSRLQVFSELFGPEDSRSPGVYTASLTHRKLYLTDTEGNRFTISGTGTVDANLAEPAEADLDLPKPADFDGKESTECPRTEYSARLFVVYDTGAGYEFLNEAQIAQYKLTKEHEGAIYRQEPGEVSIAHIWVTPDSITRLQQGHMPESPLLHFDVPEVVHHIHHVQYPAGIPRPQSGLFRCLLEYPEMTLERKERFINDLETFRKWKETRETVTKELGVNGDRERSREQKEDTQIQNRVFQYRKSKAGTVIQTAEICKNEMLQKTKNRPEYESVFSSPPPVDIQEDQETEVALPGRKSAKSGVRKDAESDESGSRKAHPLIQKPSFNAGGNKSFFNYFDSPEGHIFLLENRPKTVSSRSNGVVPQLEDVDAERILNEDEKKSYEAMRDTLSQKMSNSTQQLPAEPQDDPLVVLQPEEVPKSKQKYPAQPVVLKPVTGVSCFAETEMLIKQREEQKTMEAQEYIDRKTKKYDVFGLPRASKPTVRSLRSSSPVKELNEKHVIVESATERRVKISSMANRIHMQAPSVQSMRREGVHTTIGRALAKKMTVEEVENQQNAMLNSKLQDPLTKGLDIIPEKMRFGALKEGGVYTMDCRVKNLGEQLARFRIRQPENSSVKVLYQPMPVAPGVALVFQVEVTAESPGNIETSFHIIDNTFVYTINVFAIVHSERNFEDLERENQRTKGGKSVLNPAVKRVGAEVGKEKTWEESGSSEQNFPTLPQVAKPVIDPGKSLEQMKREQ